MMKTLRPPPCSVDVVHQNPVSGVNGVAERVVSIRAKARRRGSGSFRRLPAYSIGGGITEVLYRT